MPKTLTDALMRKLLAECLKRCRAGKCSMECDVTGAKMGFCGEVWNEALK